MNLMQHIKRCMGQLENPMPVEEYIKVLRVMASSANKLADNLEVDEQLKEIYNA